MAKFIAIGGEPATGKSTIVKRLMERLELFEEEKPVLIREMAGLPVTNIGKVYVIGVYEEGENYGGTDRLPLNVQPRAEKFCDILNPQARIVVVFEGDRLFNEKYLEYILRTGHQLRTFVVQASVKEKNRRHTTRGDKQDETWKKGRATKVHAIVQHSQFLDNRYCIRILENEEEADIARNANVILEEVLNAR